MANVFRVIIVLVFLAIGIIIGNIYIPQKNFDQRFIIAPENPKTELNLENAPSVDTILKQAENYKNLLIASGQDEEEIIGFENNFKRTILQLYYKEAAANYSLELLKMQLCSENTPQYIKARAEYQKLIDLIEKLYPLEQQKEVLVITANTVPSSTTASTQTASAIIMPSTETLKGLEVSTSTIVSTNTISTATAISTNTAKVN